MTKLHGKFRLPIAIKLIGLTVSLLIAITSLIALKSSKYFEKEIRQTHERSNQVQVQDRATQVEALLQAYIDKIRTVAPLLHLTYPTEELKSRIIDTTFKPDKDLVTIEIHAVKDSTFQLVTRILNSEFLKSKRFDEAYIEQLRLQRPLPLDSIFSGNIEVLNSSLEGGIPLVTVGIPLIKDDYDRVSHIAVADIRIEKLQKAFSLKSASEIFLVDKIGRVLAHPRDEYTIQGRSFADHPLVMEALDSKFRSNHIPLFWNPEDQKNYYGVYSQTIFGVSVIAQVPENIIREPALHVQRQAYYMGGLVLSSSLFLIFLFSMTLTRPIEKLLELTREVAKGNFDVHASEKVTSKDEVNDLAIAFDHMTTGLKALVRTQGADVAETLMASDLEHLGGTKKKVTVLFSDLRDFTKFSEGHTPEEVVEMLNEYFEVMVGCIERNQGHVNKFIGDAIMAMWGAPNSSGQDVVLAVRAALDMRIELEKLNQVRIGRNEPPIKIGVGLHCGEAVAGTIGSKSRLEYTIIGDTVNQASRIEASTKAFGTDLLVSQEIVNEIEAKFFTELAGSAEVKGKVEPLKMYRVKGFYNLAGEAVEVKTPYSEYKSEAVDKIKVA